MSTHDKREILKLKQGLIEDSEIIKKDEPEVIVLRGKKKAENFWYHYKIHVLMVLLLGIMLGFFVIEALTKKRADINFLLVVSGQETGMLVQHFAEDIREAVEYFTPNFDGNRYIYAQSFPIDLTTNDPNNVISNQTKLFGEIRSGENRLMMGDRRAFEHILGDTGLTLDYVFVDLKQIYPNNDSIIDNVFFRVKGSDFTIIAGIDEVCTDDFYIAILNINKNGSKQEQAHERALEVLDNIVRDKIINQ